MQSVAFAAVLATILLLIFCVICLVHFQPQFPAIYIQLLLQSEIKMKNRD
jgi:hypothetical protein